MNLNSAGDSAERAAIRIAREVLMLPQPTERIVTLIAAIIREEVKRPCNT